MKVFMCTLLFLVLCHCGYGLKDEDSISHIRRKRVGSAKDKLDALRPAGNPVTSKSGPKTTYQYTKAGGFAQANQDFNSLHMHDVKDYPTPKGLTRVGHLDEYTVNVREHSSGNYPTLEYFVTNNRYEITKIRY